MIFSFVYLFIFQIYIYSTSIVNNSFSLMKAYTFWQPCLEMLLILEVLKTFLSCDVLL